MHVALKSSLRAILAAIVAPFAVIPALIITTLIAGIVFPDDSGVSRMTDVSLFAMYGIPIAFVAVVVVGLPAHLLFSWLGWHSYLVYGAGGGLAALLVGAVTTGWSLDPVGLLYLMMFCMCGIFVSLLARLVGGGFRFSMVDSGDRDIGT